MTTYYSGWLATFNSVPQDWPPDHTNSGSAESYFSRPTFTGGLEDFEGTKPWPNPDFRLVWVPVVADDPPTLEIIEDGVFSITLGELAVLPTGTATVISVVDGVDQPTLLKLVLVGADSFYGSAAWYSETASVGPTSEQLPELLAPGGLCFLTSSNAITPDSMHDDIAPMLGHDLKRKVQTYAPQIVDVEAVLEPLDAYAVWEWFEKVLIVGSEKFTARVAELGPNSRYWISQWVAPPQWEALHLGRYRLRGQLMLTGQGWGDPPETVTLELEFGMDLIGSAVIRAPVELEAEFAMELRARSPFAVEFALTLEVYVPSYELREDGGRELREDGGYELRE